MAVLPLVQPSVPLDLAAAPESGGGLHLQVGGLCVGGSTSLYIIDSQLTEE